MRLNKWLFFSSLLKRRLLHDSQGRRTRGEVRHIGLFPVQEAIALKKWIDTNVIDLFFRVDIKRVGVSPALVWMRRVFTLEEEEKQPRLRVRSQTSRSLLSRPSVHFCSGQLSAPWRPLCSLSDLLFLLLLLLLRLPNPTHATLQSSSSCPPPDLSIFYFPVSFPSSCPPLPPSSAACLQPFSPSLLCPFLLFLDPAAGFLLLWQGRSPSRARSCLKFVNGDVMQ